METLTLPTVTTQESLTDDALMSAICQRAEWAMKLLYDRYYRYAYALAYNVVHDHATVEDILQEAFLAIWNKAFSYHQQQGSVRSWLQTIVYHRAIDRVRAHATLNHQLQFPQTTEEHDVPDNKPEVWDEVWYNERCTLIRSVLNELPTEQRQVIELSYFGGLTHIEIAEQWDIPLGTVKGRMRLGLQKMRRLLMERGLDNPW